MANRHESIWKKHNFFEAKMNKNCQKTSNGTLLPSRTLLFTRIVCFSLKLFYSQQNQSDWLIQKSNRRKWNRNTIRDEATLVIEKKWKYSDNNLKAYVVFRNEKTIMCPNLWITIFRGCSSVDWNLRFLGLK